MSQNKILKGRLNPVVILFDFSGSGFSGLDDFTKITAKFGNDERNSVDDPTSVVKLSNLELELNFQDTTEVRSHHWCIDGDNNELTSSCLGNLNKSTICEGC